MQPVTVYSARHYLLWAGFYFYFGPLPNLAHYCSSWAGLLATVARPVPVYLPDTHAHTRPRGHGDGVGARGAAPAFRRRGCGREEKESTRGSRSSPRFYWASWFRRRTTGAKVAAETAARHGGEMVSRRVGASAGRKGRSIMTTSSRGSRNAKKCKLALTTAS